MSNFHPDTGGGDGLLFRFTCSVMLQRGRGACRQLSLTCVGNTRSVPATWVCTHSRRVCFPHLHCSGSRLFSRKWALSCVHFPGLSHSGSSFRVLHKSADLVGPEFCAFPSPSSSGSQELEERTLAGCGAPSPLHSPSLGFPVGRTLCLFWGAGL